MNNLLNFIDTGFIIILVMLLIISGGIMFYCYRRLNLLEDSIINQGRILQNLIINLQNNNLNNDNNTSDELIETEETEESNLVNNNTINNKNKIDVSDNDSEISDTDESILSDNDSDINDNNLDINDNSLDINNISLDINDRSLDINDNSLDINDSNLDIQEITDNPSTKILELTEDVLDDITDKQFMSNINNYDTSKNDEKKIDNKIKGLSKMKIDDIKQLIIDKNINLDDDINSMKKVDLIKILSN
jgi:hypothetical protein